MFKKNRALVFIAQTSKKELFRLFLLTVSNILNASLAVYFALAMRNVINHAVAGEGTLVRHSAAVLIGVVICEIFLFVAIRMLSAQITARLEIAFRESVFSKILKKDYSQISRFHSGDVQTRLWSDVTTISDNVATLIPGVCGLITRLVGALAAVFVVDSTFALIILCGGVVLFVFSRALRGVMKRTHKDVQEKAADLRAFHQESIENVLVIKTFDMENKIREGEKSRSAAHYKKKIIRALYSTGASCGFSTLITFGHVYAVIWCAWKLMSGDSGFEYGDFVAIMQLINQIQAPFASLSGSLSKYYSAIASTERLLELVDLPEDEESREVSGLYEKIKSINFSGVSFSYGETAVFENADCRIEKGSLTVVSGISGIGKSTMIKLIMGVLKPQQGEIFLETEEGREICNSSLRRLFAYVPQGNLLMSGTVRENMLLAKSDATDEEILSALRLSAADFIDELSEGLSSVLGERGSGLSEGQVQRLAIARAILCGAPILLLDEATSALDEETEKRVLQNIMSIEGKTCIAISHRSAARKVCTKEIYVREGKICERE
ncbi:MAG: ABC transporter ATP-binding protein [Oscillospiraceae bacterium]|nr:ABC transporter ATP-binding protein [Oscillospiraceae bacterium]